MQKLPLLLLTILFACSTTTQKQETTSEPSRYPDHLLKMFDKHGSLDAWKKMRAMSYEITGEEGNEKQQIDLRNRRERIEATNFATGFDGTNIWLDADSTYEGNPVFYHNLMFYFYAMPFVLADEGINYAPADTLTFEDKKYPGFKITYQSNVGISPEDEYYLHYDAESYQMTWLGYTVTFFSKEKSKEVRWIRYNQWQEIQGLVLPEALTWYKYDNNQLTEPRGTAEFVNVMISEKAFADSIFSKPEEAVFVLEDPDTI
ncbi:MAG: DUF6503 family protein [Reichenbachiella sp.]|uniref:DUF6503 family protein n=1 Tax=Reichenbachiella sp. TaxID=2184521 RepID=UPI003265F114